jgi:NADH-quinone oxidoreductase subunit G
VVKRVMPRQNEEVNEIWICDKGRFAYHYMGGGDLVMQVGVGQGTNFSDLGKGDAILVVASDLYEEAPIWWLRVKQAADRGATLIVANPRETKLDRFANYVVRYSNGDEVKTVRDLGGEGKIAEAFAKAENAIVLLGSDGLGLTGSSNLAAACANLLVKTGHTGKRNNGLIGVWPKANDQGAWEIGFRPVADLQDKYASR